MHWGKVGLGKKDGSCSKGGKNGWYSSIDIFLGCKEGKIKVGRIQVCEIKKQLINLPHNNMPNNTTFRYNVTGDGFPDPQNPNQLAAPLSNIARGCYSLYSTKVYSPQSQGVAASFHWHDLSFLSEGGVRVIS